MRSDQGSADAPQFLLIERDPAAVRGTEAMVADLPGRTPELTVVSSGRGGLEQARQHRFDIVMADLGSLADLGDAVEDAIGRVCRAAEGALVVALAADGSVSSAVTAMRSGAHDYLTKPLSATAFAARICELARRHGNARALSVEGGTEIPADFAGFVGVSEQMRLIYEQIVRIAPSSAAVFITGESGTGKELCAEALHQHGPRRDGPFVPVNCAAIPRDLMESALFGVVRGAYTGAESDRAGAVELAHGGVLFLDEIGELDQGLQSKLLRFLQTGTVTRVGEATGRQVDVRVVCATNRNPMQLIADKKFREDLFYRLHVLPIHLPPLRQRPSDILPLAQSFLGRCAREENKRFTSIAPETADLFVAREWPGNVRQLQNLIRRIVVMFDGEDITQEMVAAADVESRGLAEADMSGIAAAPQPIEPMWIQEKRIIETALDRFNGNISQAAAALEISPSTIYRKRQGWEQAGGVAGAA